MVKKNIGKKKDTSKWVKYEARKQYDKHSDNLVKDLQYISYGILISLFYYSQNGFLNTCSVLWSVTAILSILTLVLSYYFSAYIFVRTETILIKASKKQFEEKCEESYHACSLNEFYDRMRQVSMRIFWSFQITLMASVFSFLISSWFYFYGNQCEKSPNEKTETLHKHETEQHLNSKVQSQKDEVAQKAKSSNLCG